LLSRAAARAYFRVGSTTETFGELLRQVATYSAPDLLFNACKSVLATTKLDILDGLVLYMWFTALLAPPPPHAQSP